MYMTKEGKKCLIYIRVSSERQVKGNSLDGQKHFLTDWAERQGMSVIDTASDKLRNKRIEDYITVSVVSDGCIVIIDAMGRRLKLRRKIKKKEQILLYPLTSSSNVCLMNLSSIKLYVPRFIHNLFAHSITPSGLFRGFTILIELW